MEIQFSRAGEQSAAAPENLAWFFQLSGSQKILRKPLLFSGIPGSSLQLPLCRHVVRVLSSNLRPYSEFNIWPRVLTAISEWCLPYLLPVSFLVDTISPRTTREGDSGSVENVGGSVHAWLTVDWLAVSFQAIMCSSYSFSSMHVPSVLMTESGWEPSCVCFLCKPSWTWNSKVPLWTHGLFKSLLCSAHQA